MRIVGYDSFIYLIKAAYGLRLVGVPSAHVLVVSPPGTAKTTIAKLFAKAVGAAYVRTTGRYDMLPEDFIAEKEIVYDGGNPKIVWRLRAVSKLLASENTKPGVWFFDEFDKMNRKSMMSLLELMEEQQVTLPTGEAYGLNFLLVAAGNSRKYDRDASPIPRSVRDRFAVYWELGYLPVELEVEVLDQGIRQMLGVDAEPSEQFSFRFDRSAFERNLSLIRRMYGECFVRAVAYLRTHKMVEEPPGPRGYIHATLLAASLATVGYGDAASSARLGFVAGVSGKITVSQDTTPFEVCQEAFERFCTRKGDEDLDSGVYTSPTTEPMSKPSTSTKVRILLDDQPAGQRSRGSGGSRYSLTDVASYLMSLGGVTVVTDKGAMPASVAGKMVLSGGVTSIAAPGGTTIKIYGGYAVATKPIAAAVGRDTAEITYSDREIELVKVADLLSEAGVPLTSFSILASEPVEVLAKVVESVSQRRRSPLYPQLKSALRNLLDVVGDIVVSREGDRPDSLTNQIARASRSGEFEGLAEHERHRLHVVRTLQRLATGSAREVFKTYVEMGRGYVIVFDRSGSMGDEVASGATKKAVAALIAILIAKSDPEARFSLVTFDAEAKVLVRQGSADDVINHLFELEPAGGTSYTAGLEAASKVVDEGDILVVVGDFIDGSRIPNHVAEKIVSRASKRILVPCGEYDHQYAEHVAETIRGSIYVYHGGSFVQLR